MAASDDEDRKLDYLLAQGRLPGPEKERIKDALLAQARPQQRSARRWVLAALAGGLAVGVGAFLLVPRMESFSVKGGGGRAQLEVECLGGSPDACPVGSTLMFVVSGSPRVAFLTAYAEPASAGEPIWYYSAQEDSPAVGADRTVPLRRGIRIGSEHRPGRYRLHLLLSERPLRREEALAARSRTILATRTLPLTVVLP
jgi:hypothetical protein